MNSQMVYLPYTCDVYFHGYPEYITVGDVLLQDPKEMPWNVRMWIMSDVSDSFFPTQEEYDMKVNYTTRKVEFEVEVQYYDNGSPKTATCQNTGLPGYVAAYLEKEAMKQFTLDNQEVK